MHIAYFIGTLRKADGVALVLLDLVREAVRQGHACVIVTGWAEDASQYPVPVIEVPSMVFPLYRDYRLPLPGMRGFEKRLTAFAPDLIHVHSPDTLAYAAARYARKHGVPIMATHHTDFGSYLSYYHISWLAPLLWLIITRLYRKMRLVTTPSPATKADLAKHGIRNVRVLPWGLDFSRFDPSFRSEAWRKKVLRPGTSIIVLTVCRLTWEKDLRTLAEAHRLLSTKRADYTMVVAGDGPAAAELRTLMPGAVFFGRLASHELSEAYASADLFLFPSTTETFGSVTIEAMASGLVPVVANAEGSASLVEEEVTGFLARPKDAEDTAAKTALLLDDPGLRAVMRGKALAFVQKFRWERVLGELLEIYRGLTV